MNYSDIKGFLSNWVSNNYMLQRIGMLYGYYSEDPNYKDGVRAIIEAVYEPP
jgi:nuclear protein localization family protein 4